MIRIAAGDLDDDRVLALLRAHLAVARGETAPGSAHALDVEGLRSPNIALWTGWEGSDLVACAALKRLTQDEGELKSMHTAQRWRGRGYGGAMLRHAIGEARSAGLRRLSLQTSTWAFFRPAVALYRAHGFAECAPFAAYAPDPNSVFLSLDIGDPRRALVGARR